MKKLFAIVAVLFAITTSASAQTKDTAANVSDTLIVAPTKAAKDFAGKFIKVGNEVFEVFRKVEPGTPQVFHFVFSGDFVQGFYGSLDQSNAPHSTIEALKKALAEQVNAQLPKQQQSPKK